MDVARQRLLSQRIEGEQWKTPEEVVKWMGAMQAQDYLQSVWAIGSRMQVATLKAVEQAIADGKILRTWPMRGTIHFVPAEDAKWMLKLTASRMLASDKRRQQQLELDEHIIGRAGELLYAALQGGKRLTRPNVIKLLEEASIRTEGQRGYHILWYLAQIGLICLGPLEGRQQTFVLLDEWVPSLRELSCEEGLALLARRYFASHGPATIQDFAWWTGLTITEVRAGFEAIKSAFAAEKIQGREYFLANDALSRNADCPSSLHLLPGFDEYLLGYKDRNAVLAVEHAQKIVPGNNGVFRPIVVVAGQIVGTWQRTVKKSACDLFIQPFIQLDNLEEEASGAINRYCAFLGLPLSSTGMQIS